MESSRNRQKAMMSKYVLSNLVMFVPLSEALRLRQVAKKFDEAVMLGLNALYFEMNLQADRLQYIMDTTFDKETQDQHKTLAERELIINLNLREFLGKANQGDLLFKNYTEIAYLKRPNHLITKPIIAVLILLGKCPKIKADVDYMKKVDLDEIWMKVLAQVKDKKFLKQLQQFDIRSVTQRMMNHIAELFKND